MNLSPYQISKEKCKFPTAMTSLKKFYIKIKSILFTAGLSRKALMCVTCKPVCSMFHQERCSVMTCLV